MQSLVVLLARKSNKTWLIFCLSNEAVYFFYGLLLHRQTDAKLRELFGFAPCPFQYLIFQEKWLFVFVPFLTIPLFLHSHPLLNLSEANLNVTIRCTNTQNDPSIVTGEQNVLKVYGNTIHRKWNQVVKDDLIGLTIV
jgi:hypothetical protein